MTAEHCPSCGQSVIQGPKPLTPRQMDALHAIVDWIDRCHMPPTLVEIAVAINATDAANVQKLVKVIEEKGWIRKAAPVRGIVVLHRPPEANDTQAPGRRLHKRRKLVSDPVPAGDRLDCLQCGCPFMSAGLGNRICDSCKERGDWSSGNDFYATAGG